MTALFYIVRKSIKNTFLELLKKPGKLVLYLLIFAICVGAIVLTIFVGNDVVEQTMPMFWFTGILFAFIALFVAIHIVKGLADGDAMFDMSDVNLLFVSPISPRKILVYGIVRLVKISFLAMFFILFQSSTLANFGIHYGGVFLTLFACMLSMIVLSIMSLVIYSVTNGRPRRKQIVRVAAVCVFLPLAIFVASQYIFSGDILAALEAGIRSPLMSLIPVAGWMAAGVTSLLSGEGNLLTSFICFGANLLFGGGLLAYLFLSKLDYYEDTLVASETAYEKKRIASEGDMTAAAMASGKDAKNIKVKKTGIAGIGASAIFGKHVRESFRQNRLGFLSLTSIFIILGAIIVVLVVKDIFVMAQILIWVQIFMIGTGRGLMETYSHYIYMIPESSFSKIIWSNMEIMLRTAIETLLIFGIAGVALKSNPLFVLTLAVCYLLFSFLLLGVNYFFVRFVGANISKGVLIFIYCIAIIIAMLPGLVVAIAVGIVAGGNAGFLIGVLIMAAWELTAGLGCFALARGALDNCDMPTGKRG